MTDQDKYAYFLRLLNSCIYPDQVESMLFWIDYVEFKSSNFERFAYEDMKNKKNELLAQEMQMGIHIY